MFIQRFCLALCLLAWAPSLTSRAQTSKGHQILIDRGFQVQGMIFNFDPFHLNTYSNANYTAMNWIWDSTPSAMGTAPGFPWARWSRDETEMPPRTGEEAYLSQLLMIQLGDEWELNNDATRTRLVDWFNAVRANWPNTILFHNNYGGQVGDAQLGDFVTRAQPDMLSFDAYPFRLDGLGNKYETLVNWYGDMRRYRQHAMGANIPLATYLQTYSSGAENVSAPSPSELRLQHFAALAFNCKTLMDFTYNGGSSSLFTNVNGGDNAPNALYYEKANCALRARNFGKALVRLKPVADVSFPDLRTTGMMFILGRNSSGALNPFPIGFYAGPGGGDVTTDWAYQRHDPYLTNNWVITNKGTKNNGQPGNVIVSWFRPLDESFDGPDYTNEIYMMVVNGLSDLTGTAPECLQEIKLNFATNLTALEMLNPLTGLVEVQSLPLTNGFRQLVLNLNGGDAALFKFSDGAPFIGAQLTGPPVITSQPASQTVMIGTAASFSARAAGGAPLSYRWQFNGVNISGATTNSYTRMNVQNGDAGAYTLIVSNSFSSVTSAPAILTVVSNLPPRPPFFYEPFDYTNIGNSVSSNTPANWAFGGSGANDLNVASGSLSYGSLVASVGNSVTNGGAGLGVRRLFGTNINSGTLYFSALFRINDLGYGTGGWTGTASQIGALTDTNATSNFRLAVMIKSNSPSAYVIGVQKGGTLVTATFDTTEYHTNETIFLVGKYDFNVSPNAVSLWINPSSSTFGSASAPTNGFISATTGTDGFTIDRFNIRQNTATSVPAAMQWDELRIDGSWAAVTPGRAPVKFTSISLLPDTRVRLQGSGDPGNFIIESSTNLVGWSELTNIFSTNGTFEYFATTTNQTQRYFRLRVSP
ncbi:MAG: immunoglobulin domain-containing protein [Verrucomicrobiota bacterium]